MVLTAVCCVCYWLIFTEKCGGAAPVFVDALLAKYKDIKWFVCSVSVLCMVTGFIRCAVSGDFVCGFHSRGYINRENGV